MKKSKRIFNTYNIIGYFFLVGLFFFLTFSIEPYQEQIPGWFYFAPHRTSLAISFNVVLLSISYWLILFMKEQDNLYISILFFFPTFFQLVLSSHNSTYIYFSTACVIAFFITLLVFKIFKNKKRRWEGIYVNANFIINGCLILSIFLLVGLYFYNGRYINFDIEYIYDFRDEIGQNLPSFFSYTYFVCSKVLLPVSLVYSIIEKKYFYILLNFVLTLLLFGLTQQRAIVFYPIVVIIIYFFYGYIKKLNTLSYIVGLIIFLPLVMPDDIGLSTNFLVVRRVFLIPAWTNFLYYDFFQINPFILWSDSKITLGLLDYPYKMEKVPFLIGRDINMPNAHVNTGWFGSGYGHMGYLGILFYAILIGYILSIIFRKDEDVQHNKINSSIAFSGFFWAAMSSDLPSVLLTHGLLLLLLLFSFVNIRTSNFKA